VTTGGSPAALAAIEEALVTHWSLFGQWSHGTLHHEDGVDWFETPINHLPYNMVMRTCIDSRADASAVVDRVADRFRSRGVPYLWVVRPSDQPAELPHLVARQGLDLVETVTGMDLDLTQWKPEADDTDATIVAANNDPEALHDYVEMMRTYWSVPESERDLLATFNDEYSGERSPGVRLIARLGAATVGKLFMNTLELDAKRRVSIYGVAVKPEARGHGIATTLMQHALERAIELGAQSCVLHSSEMAVSLYRRMGFTEQCTLSVYATGPLFGTHHH